MSKKLLSLDFDGVLHSYTSGYTGDPYDIPDPPVKGSKAFLKEAIKHFDVGIHSSRLRHFFGKVVVRDWLIKHYGRKISDKIQLFTDKPPFHLHLDDRAATFTGKFPTMKEIESFKPWHEE